MIPMCLNQSFVVEHTASKNIHSIRKIELKNCSHSNKLLCINSLNHNFHKQNTKFERTEYRKDTSHHAQSEAKPCTLNAFR